MSAAQKKSDQLFFRTNTAATTGIDPQSAQRLEKRLLLVAITTGFLFAMLGLIWGALINSQMLIFDGIYSFVSMIMTTLSYYASNVIFAEEDDERFPFGRSQIEPLVIILKGVAIITVCIFAFNRAAGSLMAGGREINALSAMVYSLIGIPGCLIPWFYIARKRNKASHSGLTRAESRQLFSDTLLSSAMFIGFLLAHLSRGTQHDVWAQYADPVMVIIAVFFFASAPLNSMIGGVRDMLRMAPGGNIYRISRQALGEIAKKHAFDGFVLRIGKMGRNFYYEIGFVGSNPADTRSIGELDLICEEVSERLKELYDKPIALNISFMHNEKWG